MNGSTIAVLAIALIAFFVAAAVRTQRAARRRRDELASYAAKREWRFDAEVPGLEDRFGGEPFGRGSGRRAGNVVEGWYEGRAFVAFDYRHTTGSGDDTTTHRHAVLAVHLGDLRQQVPRLQVEPQGAVGRFFSSLLGNDLSVGDPDFDRAFQVRTESRELALDILTPDVRALAATFTDRAWRLEGDSLLVFRRGEHSPDEIDTVLAGAKALLDRIPPPVWDRLRGGETPR